MADAVEEKQNDNQGPSSLRFRELALERRRPSKRTTTLRTFSIVRNWETRQNEQPAIETPKKVKERPLPITSPEFLPAQPHSQELETVLPHKSTTTQYTEDPESSPTCHSEVIPATPSAELVVPKIIIPKLRHPSPALPSLEPLPASQPTPGDSPYYNVVTTNLPQEDEVPTSSKIPGITAIDDATPTASSAFVTMVTMASDADVQSPVDASVIASPGSIIMTSMLSQEKPSMESHPKTADQLLANADPKPVKPVKPRRGKKRKQAESSADEAKPDEQEEEPSGKRFVRLYNADQGRKVSVAEVTELDVVLTEIEEIALQYREDIESSVVRQAIKEYFIQIRKQFSDSIDLNKECKTLKTECTKVNTRLGKVRKELLSVQQKRARIRGELTTLEKEHKETELHNQDLSSISQFLYDMEYVKEKRRRNPSTKQDFRTVRNLPGLLCEANTLLTAATGLGQINTSLETLLQTMDQI